MKACSVSAFSYYCVDIGVLTAESRRGAGIARRLFGIDASDGVYQRMNRLISHGSTSVSS